jgi:hypothetical protein
MRQRIAERLKEAQNTNAMLTTFNEVDMRYVAIYVLEQIPQVRIAVGLSHQKCSCVHNP